MTALWTQRSLTLALTAVALTLPVSIAGANIALGLLTAALAAHAALGGHLDWRRAWVPAVWAISLYCAVAVLAAVTGVSPAASLRNLYKDVHKLWVLLILLLAFRAAPAWRRPAALAAGFFFIASFAILRSCYDSYQSFHQDAVFYGYHRVWVRAHGFIHPVTFGEMMGLGLLGGFVFWLRSEDGLGRRLSLILSAVLLAALILSDTRGAFFGVLAGLAALCAVTPVPRRWIGWGLLIALLGALSLGLLPTGRSLVSAFQSEGAALGANQQLNRFILWDVAWRIFKDHPWTGVGPANFGTAYPLYFQGMFDGARVWTSAHNIVLHQMAERGLLGLAALLTLGWALLARAWQRAREDRGPWNLWALSATVAFMVMNITETAFQVEQITTLFLAIWACAEAGAPPKRARP